MASAIARIGAVVLCCACGSAQAQLGTINHDTTGTGMAYLAYDTAIHVLYGAPSMAVWNGVEVNRIWQWANGTFNSVGGGLSQAFIRGLDVYEGNVFLSGDLNVWTNDYDIHHIGRWDGTAWHSSGEPNATTWLFRSVEDLWCNGNFDSIAGQPVAGQLARLVDGGWETFGSPAPSVNSFRAAAYYAGEYYFGGNLLPPWIAEDIVKWDGAEWQSVGGGLQSSPLGEVTSMQVYGGRLIVGGWIDAPPDPGRSVICWNGLSWEGFFPEVVTNLSPWCRDLEIIDGKLYLTGSWVFAGDDRVYAVLIYDGEHLCGVGSTTIAEYGHGFQITGNADSIFFGTTEYILSGDTVNYYAVWPVANGPDTCVTIPTGMREAARDERLHVYPNPAVAELTIDWSGSKQGPAEVHVFDMLGRCVLSGQRTAFRNGRMTMDVSALVPGMYAGQVQGVKRGRFQFLKE